MGKLSKTDKKHNKAVRHLIKATDRNLVLLASPENNLYLLPAILDSGCIEYQLSNGMEGRRSHSEDYSSFAEAVERFNHLKEGGGLSSIEDHQEAEEIKREWGVADQ